jgi:hypothetical protein
MRQEMLTELWGEVSWKGPLRTLRRGYDNNIILDLIERDPWEGDKTLKIMSYGKL